MINWQFLLAFNPFSVLLNFFDEPAAFGIALLCMVISFKSLSFAKSS